MKKFYAFIPAIIISLFIGAQNPVPNPSFETTWTGGKPNGWTDCQDINQVAPGQGGGSAAQGYKTATTYPAFITSSGGIGFSISTAYSYLNLYYKFTSVSSDIMYVGVKINDAAHSQIGSGTQMISASTQAGTYIALSIPIYYSGSGPAEAIISVLMNPSSGVGNPHVGSNFFIDKVSLTTTALAVQDIEKETSLLHVFPNPATNYIQIVTEGLNGKVADVQLMDMSGRIVKEITQVTFSNSNFRLAIDHLPVGNYLLAIKNDEMIQTKRLVIE